MNPNQASVKKWTSMSHNVLAISSRRLSVAIFEGYPLRCTYQIFHFHLSYTLPLTILKQGVFITNFQTSAQGDKNNTIFRTREPSTSFPELLPWRSSSLGNEVGEPWILMWTSEITCLTGFILYTSFEVKSTQFMFYKERRQIYLDFLKLKVFIYKMFHFYEEFL